MSTNAKHTESAYPDSGPGQNLAPQRKRKTLAMLITADEGLWQTLAKAMPSHFSLKQADSVEQALGMLDPGAASVLIWDTRNEANIPDSLGRLQQHSERLAVVSLDVTSAASRWASLIRQNQIVALVAEPFPAAEFIEAINLAAAEVETRSVLLGNPEEAPATEAARPLGKNYLRWAIAGLILVTSVGGGIAVYRSQQTKSTVTKLPTVSANGTPASLADNTADPDRVDTLLEKAGSAMNERRYVTPAGNNALQYYRGVLAFDARNGEAQQGLDRLAEVLLTQAQSALDQHQVDDAVRTLEIARSIKPNDSRTQALDAKLASMRSEIGYSQVHAAINAQNYDRAALLIDAAAHDQSLTAAQLSTLRDELGHERESFEINRLVKLAQARLAQDQLVSPANDNAAYYIDQAHRAGASDQVIAQQTRALIERIATVAHAAIDQRRFSDADRLLSEAANGSIPAATLQPLQHDLAAARTQQARVQSEQQRLLDLLQRRLAQGSLIDPQNDSALYYLNALKSADAKNSAIPDLSRSIQSQILERARAAFEQNHLADAKSLLHVADGLGGSAEQTALAEKIAAAEKHSTPTSYPLVLLKPILLDYPAAAADKGVEGWVLLKYLVKADGKITDIQVVDSSPAGIFDKAAITALSHAQYKALSATDPSASQQSTLRLSFRLTSKRSL